MPCLPVLTVLSPHNTPPVTEHLEGLSLLERGRARDSAPQKSSKCADTRHPLEANFSAFSRNEGWAVKVFKKERKWCLRHCPEWDAGTCEVAHQRADTTSPCHPLLWKRPGMWEPVSPFKRRPVISLRSPYDWPKPFHSHSPFFDSDFSDAFSNVWEFELNDLSLLTFKDKWGIISWNRSRVVMRRFYT